MSDILGKIKELEGKEKELKKKKRELLKRHQEEIEKKNCKKVNINALERYLGKDVRVHFKGQDYNFNVNKIEIKSLEVDFGEFSYSAKDVNDLKSLLAKWVKAHSSYSSTQNKIKNETKQKNVSSMIDGSVL